jgi:hypothetical protein
LPGKHSLDSISEFLERWDGRLLGIDASLSLGQQFVADKQYDNPSDSQRDEQPSRNASTDHGKQSTLLFLQAIEIA